MADDETDLSAAETETPSDEAAPEELSETPSDEEVDGDGDDSESDEADDEAEEGEDESDSSESNEPPTDPAERRAWDNLAKKFSHIRDPEDRQEAVAKAYWEKARYAKQVRRELDETKAKLARLEAERESAKPPKDEKPEELPPTPELAKVDQHIQALYAKTQALQAQQQTRLTELNRLDREVAVAEDRLKDAYDENKPLIESRLELARQRYELVKEQYRATAERIEDNTNKLDEALTQRERLEQSTRQRAQQAKFEEQSKAEFMKRFPEYVDGVIEDTAKKVGLPEDERIQTSLWKHVNRALALELRRLNVSDIRQANVPGLIQRFVKEYADDRDLISRRSFKEKSDQKLRVAGRASGTGGKEPVKSGNQPALPASKKAPVPVSLLSGDDSPGMARARARLISKFGG